MTEPQNSGDWVSPWRCRSLATARFCANRSSYAGTGFPLSCEGIRLRSAQHEPKIEILKEAGVQVSVSVRHGQLQPGDQQLIEEKVEKLRRLFDRVNAIEVIVDLKEIDNPLVELMVSAEHSSDCVATANASTVLAALDTAIPKMEQQLRKAKDKLTGHRATGHKHIDSNAITD